MQILLNLVSNSIKYTHNGSITVIIEEQLDKVKFIVEDTGIGIDEDKKIRIFKPYEQIQFQNNTRYGGIGLGLYLCKLVVTNMRGIIDFESEVDKGSTFYFIIDKEFHNGTIHNV